MSSIGLLARDLENTVGRNDVIATVNTLIEQIDAHIQECNEAGNTHADTELLQAVSVTGLPLAEAQAVVYSELLEIYASDPDDEVAPGKGFHNVKLIIETTPRGQVWYLHTEWKNMLSAAEKAERMAIIEKYTVRRQRPAPAAPRAPAQNVRR